MRKIASALLSAILLLGLSACSNDEPQDQIWLMSSQFINHVTNSDDGTFVSATLGGATAEFNVTKMTASIDYALAIGEEQIIVSATNARLTAAGSKNGYYIDVPSATTTSGHTVTNLLVYIDMNLENEISCHWATATIDGKYELNALVPTIVFYNTESTINKLNGQTITNGTGDYKFIVSNITTEHRSASLSIAGIEGLEPFYSGIEYNGLSVEPTSTGLHIYCNEAVQGKGRTDYKLNSIDANIDFTSLSFKATLNVQDTGTITATGSM